VQHLLAQVLEQDAGADRSGLGNALAQAHVVTVPVEQQGERRTRRAAPDDGNPQRSHGPHARADPALSEGFHEGTAWQYQWLVPQGLPGLIDTIGGKDEVNARLDHFFDYTQ